MTEDRTPKYALRKRKERAKARAKGDAPHYQDPPGFEPGRMAHDPQKPFTQPRTPDGKYPIYSR